MVWVGGDASDSDYEVLEEPTSTPAPSSVSRQGVWNPSKLSLFILFLSKGGVERSLPAHSATHSGTCTIAVLFSCGNNYMTGSKKSQGFIYVFLLKELDYEQSMLFGEVRRTRKKVSEKKVVGVPLGTLCKLTSIFHEFFSDSWSFTEKQGQPVVC